MSNFSNTTIFETTAQSNKSSFPAQPSVEPSYTQTFQVLIVIPILFILVVTFFGFTGFRNEKRRKDMKDIRSRTAGRDAKMPITAAFIKVKHREALKRETERCLDVSGRFGPDSRGTLQKEFEERCARTRSLPSDINGNYGRTQSNASVNKTSVNTGSMQPRDFMQFLMKQYPNLEPNLSRHYIRMYEYARFGRQEIPQSVYTRFWERLFTLMSFTKEDED